MRIRKESQILDDKIRKKIIDEIKGTENVKRKQESLKRYEIYKDKTNKYVLKRLSDMGLEPATIKLMSAHISNISVAKKIVNKLARSYSGGVNRSTESAEVNASLSNLLKLSGFDKCQKKIDKTLVLHRNAMAFIKPEVCLNQDSEEYKIKSVPLSPWQYDVVEDYYDREKPLVVILSDFVERDTRFTGSNLNDDTLADIPGDSGMGKAKTYIWWSNNYHFTTDANGKIINELTPENAINPIGMLPFVNYAIDQDGEFWAEGGDDLTEGSILINLLITDMLTIAYQQGWGQLVITGKNIKEGFKVGPHQALIFEYDEGDPKPEIDVLSPNPPLDLWMKAIEQYVALLLSTNNLSPSAISIRLDAGAFPSGIAMIIEMSEATDSIEDKQSLFQAGERESIKIGAAWQNYYFETKSLTPEFMAIGKLPENIEASINFGSVKPVVSEKEKLENIRTRKDLGINEEVELIMLDNPDMTLEQAEEKLLKIKAEKLNRVAAAASNFIQKNNEPEDKDDESVDG